MIKQIFCPQCGAGLVEREMGGLERKVCPAPDCGYVYWNNPIPVVAAIVEVDDCVLLGRNREWPEKMFGLITGFLEAGETPENGVVREVKEELGLDAQLQEMVGIYSSFEQNQIIFAYHLCAEGEPVLGEELAEYKAVPIKKLRPWPFATGLAVRDWLQKRRRSD